MNTPPSTKRQQQRAEMQAAIFSEHPSLKEMTYLPTIFTQVNMPRSNISKKTYKCENGDAWILIQAGSLDMGNGPVEQNLPYGVLPRLILCHIATQVLLKKTAVIDLEESASKFLRKIGLDSQGSHHTMLTHQICSLAACRLQMGYRGKTYNGHPIQQFELFKHRNGRVNKIWPKQLVLSDDFFQSIIGHAVPLDFRAIKQLSSSSLALDIYVWLAHRLCRLKNPTLLYWCILRKQFSPESIGPHANKSFKKYFKVALKKVLQVYPNAKVKQIRGGIYLQKSLPPVLTKPQELKINDNRICPSKHTRSKS